MSFLDDLKSWFGPVQPTAWAPATSVASASGEGLLSSGKTIFYGYSYTITAANSAIDLRFHDVSATALNTPARHTIRYLPAGTNVVTFSNPILFDKGLAFQISASGTATPQFYLHFAGWS